MWWRSPYQQPGYAQAVRGHEALGGYPVVLRPCRYARPHVAAVAPHQNVSRVSNGAIDVACFGAAPAPATWVCAVLRECGNVARPRAAGQRSCGFLPLPPAHWRAASVGPGLLVHRQSDASQTTGVACRARISRGADRPASGRRAWRSLRAELRALLYCSRAVVECDSMVHAPK